MFNLKILKPKQPTTGSYLDLSLKMAILPPGISEGDCVWELSPPILYSSLGLGLKVCTTTAWFLWQTSAATSIKGVCPHCLVCKTDQWACFTLWSSGKLYVLKYKWNITTPVFNKSPAIVLCLSVLFWDQLRSPQKFIIFWGWDPFTHNFKLFS